MQLNEVLDPFTSPSSSTEARKALLRRLLAPSAKTPPAPTLSASAKGALKRIPPVRRLLQQRYDKKFATLGRANLFRGVYGDFASARASAPKTKAIGYDHEGPASMYRDHVERVYPMDYPALLWLGALLGEARSVFDFGGHIGVAYYSFARHLRYPEGMRWRVYDVPAVVSAGRRFAEERGETALAFTQDERDCDGFDVFYAAGSLQYAELDLAELLSGLKARPAHVLVNKLPVTRHQGCVTLQSIGTAFCPYRVFNEEDFVAGMTQAGYELVDSWQTPDLRCDIPYHPEYSDIRYHGYCFRAR